MDFNSLMGNGCGGCSGGGCSGCPSAAESSEQFVDLKPFIQLGLWVLLNALKLLTKKTNSARVECLNEDAHYTAKEMLQGHSALKSDIDAQLVLTLPFNPNVRIHTFGIECAGDGTAPKKIRLIINRPNLSFDDVGRIPAMQEISVTPAQISSNRGHLTIPLNFLKFTNVATLTIFVESNQGAETTTVHQLHLLGRPNGGLQMQNWSAISLLLWL